MAVSPAFRGTGAGKLLADEALARAQQQACRLRVRCDTRREAANRFYEAAVFALVKRQDVHEVPLPARGNAEKTAGA